MIESLRLERFKNFQDATLKLGPLTILIGANASGKSNIRDAFRFLHGMGRGYSLAEILGEKYGDGGELVWNGIRGGTREVAYSGSDSFTLKVRSAMPIDPSDPTSPHTIDYAIEVGIPKGVGRASRINKEKLIHNKMDSFEFTGIKNRTICKFANSNKSGSNKEKSRIGTYTNDIPVVYQIVTENSIGHGRFVRFFSTSFVRELGSLRFLDLSPTQMRIASLRGQTVLGDRGENLSSVLAGICGDSRTKDALLEWVRKLTPMDVDDLSFDEDVTGRILLSLREKDGRTISAISASDGTLRFLGVLAALFGSKPASLYFIEELENGIHPTRLGLLVELIESQSKRRDIQVVATTHSPLLLQFLSEESLGNASIVYRLPDQPDAKIKRILDIPDARRVIKEQGVSLLHASSWFEDVLDFTEDSGPEPSARSRKA